jgi:hypothetical protein
MRVCIDGRRLVRLANKPPEYRPLDLASVLDDPPEALPQVVAPILKGLDELTQTDQGPLLAGAGDRQRCPFARTIKGLDEHRGVAVRLPPVREKRPHVGAFLVGLLEQLAAVVQQPLDAGDTQHSTENPRPVLEPTKA